MFIALHFFAIKAFFERLFQEKFSTNGISTKQEPTARYLAFADFFT
jgi:hypothetical protein